MDLPSMLLLLFFIWMVVPSSNDDALRQLDAALKKIAATQEEILKELRGQNPSPSLKTDLDEDQTGITAKELPPKSLGPLPIPESARRTK